MDLIICFIDDSDFEHDLVQNEIAPFAPEVTFLKAYTFQEAKKMLGTRIPGIFLLDLWGQDIDVKTPYLLPKERLVEHISRFKTLDEVYMGLEDFKDNRINEYLKRLFTIVDGWRTLFEEVCAHIGQNRKYGIENLRQVRRAYPGIPAAFYTRKSLINDAVAMFRAGPEGLFIKPTGKGDMETRILTRKYAPELIRELVKIIYSNLGNLEKHKAFYQDKTGRRETSLDDLISSWKEFINK